MASMAPHLAEVANLVGDLARANILSALMDNRALTAGELAHAARVSPQTTSSHLAKLTNAKLLQATQARTTSLLSVGIAAGGANARNGHGGGRR